MFYWLPLVIFMMSFLPKAASAQNIYYAQAAAGANNGASCANALALPSSITGAAGNTYHLCGTFNAPAGSNYLTLSGGGTAGNPTTLLFETNAVMQATYWGGNGAISVSGSNWTIDGGTNGIIRATLNGSAGGAGCTGGPCQHLSTSSRWLTLNGVSNFELKNLSLLNLYVFSNPSDDGGGIYGIYVQDGSNITIDHNTMTYAWYTIFLVASTTLSNVSIHDNNIYNINVGIAGGDGASGATIAGPVNIYNNQIHDMAAWDDTADGNHHDGVYIWITLGASRFTGAYNIYNNYIYNLGKNCTALLYFDPGASSTYPNATAFNNVLDLGSDICGDNAVYDKSGMMRLYNNTILRGPLTSVAGSGTTLVENNISGAIQGYQFSTAAFGTSDYNDWYNLTNNPQMYYNGVSETYAAYTSSTGLDSHSITTSPNLNSSFVPNAGSPVIGKAVNLTSVCGGQPNPGLGALCYDKAGNLRPSSGGWDMGAYQSGTQSVGNPPPSPPNPPSGLVAVVN
jgi:hypothetical protein